MTPFWRFSSIIIATAFVLAGQGTVAFQTGTVPQNATIEGRVILKDGSAVPGTRVGAMTAQTTPAAAQPARAPGAESLLVSAAVTDREGRYRLENVPPGRYYLVVGPLDDPIYFPGLAPRSNATAVSVTAGAALRDRDFRLQAPPTLRVSGRVIREGHRTGTEVVINARERVLSLKTPIAADGSFEFTGIPPGRYRLFVSPNVNLPAIDVTVLNEDVTGLRISIPKSALTDATLTFNVTVENNGLLPRFELVAVPAGAPQGALLPAEKSITISSASSSMRVPLSEFRVSLPPAAKSALPEGYFIRSMMAGQTDLLQGPFEVIGDSVISISLGVSSPPPWVRVQGTVSLAEGGRVRPQTITLKPTSFASPLNVQVKPDGSFEFPMVPAGTHGVVLTPRPDPYPRRITVGSTDLSGVVIQWLIATVKVSGRLSEVPGTLPQGLSIQLCTPPEFADTPRAAPRFSAPVLVDGSFAFPGVQAGIYAVSLASGPTADQVCFLRAASPSLFVEDKDILNVTIQYGP